MFSILRTINRYNSCSIDIMLKLFNTLTSPVALYNSEVWGPLCFSSNPNNIKCFTENSNSSVSNIQLMFLRIILGVSKKSSKWAILSETGELPLISRVSINIIKYWFHLVSSSSPILHAALQTNIALSNNGCKNWYATVKKLMTFFNIDHLLYTTDEVEICYQQKKVKQILRDKYKEYWEQEVNSKREGKLSFYTQHVKENCLQEYLKCPSLPQKLRKVITRFRIGAHKLPVETGVDTTLILQEQIGTALCVVMALVMKNIT